MIMYFVVATQNTNVSPPSISQSSNIDSGENSMFSHSTNIVEKDLNLNM